MDESPICLYKAKFSGGVNSIECVLSRRDCVLLIEEQTGVENHTLLQELKIEPIFAILADILCNSGGMHYKRTLAVCNTKEIYMKMTEESTFYFEDRIKYIE